VFKFAGQESDLKEGRGKAGQNLRWKAATGRGAQQGGHSEPFLRVRTGKPDV